MQDLGREGQSWIGAIVAIMLILFAGVVLATRI